MDQRAWETIRAMFTARGYSQIRKSCWGESEGVRALDQKGLLIQLVILPGEKLNIETLKAICTEFSEQGVGHAILVYNGNMTATVKKWLEHPVSEVRIEFMRYQRLLFNILEHELVPRHTVVPKKPGIDYSKYPILSRQDAVARFLDFQRGDLVRIERKDGSLYYRIVK